MTWASAVTGIQAEIPSSPASREGGNNKSHSAKSRALQARFFPMPSALGAMRFTIPTPPVSGGLVFWRWCRFGVYLCILHAPESSSQPSVGMEDAFWLKCRLPSRHHLVPGCEGNGVTLQNLYDSLCSPTPEYSADSDSSLAGLKGGFSIFHDFDPGQWHDAC
jgi:hypothetical protein